MRYFFLIYAFLIVFVISIFGCHGDKFSKTPIRIFPDMDDQDYIGAQSKSDFFSDGMGSRKPVANTNPLGHSQDTGVSEELKGYGNKTTYLHTGLINATNFGKGLPAELDLKGNKENSTALLTRGQEVYNFKCAICHSKSGDGKGIVNEYGFIGIADLRATALPEGGIYDVIVNGKGKMGQQGRDLTLYDRWAVVAYVKMLQEAAK